MFAAALAGSDESVSLEFLGYYVRLFKKGKTADP